MKNQFALIVSRNEVCIPDCLRRALAYEFPWLEVECMTSMPEACFHPGKVVPLILVDCALFGELRRRHATVRAVYPHASLALLQDAGQVLDGGGEIVASALVRGVLPMHLKLDVWLAAFRVLLLGGEYYPLSLLQATTPKEKTMILPGAIDPPEPRTDPFCDAEAGDIGRSASIHTLTHRESQILSLVSRGLQNKLIAATLGLSEHTVKIHLHNIISKLGVHNRTQAAGIYLERRAGYSHHASPKSPMKQPSVI